MYHEIFLFSTDGNKTQCNDYMLAAKLFHHFERPTVVFVAGPPHEPFDAAA